jgi:hypothetical protein
LGWQADASGNKKATAFRNYVRDQKWKLDNAAKIHGDTKGEFVNADQFDQCLTRAIADRGASRFINSTQKQWRCVDLNYDHVVLSATKPAKCPICSDAGITASMIPAAPKVRK